MDKNKNWWKFLYPQTPIWVGTHPFSIWTTLTSGSSCSNPL